MNKHIGRLQAIGLGKESSAGSLASATAWIPKTSSDFAPQFESAVDDSAYGVIDEVFDSQTVKNSTKISVSGIVRDDWIGNMLLAAMGSETLLKCCTITGATPGTPAKGDAITSATGSWAGVIKKIIVIGSTTYYFVSTTTGTLSNQTDVASGAVWTGGTIDFSTFAAVKAHLFTRLNTNNHPTFSIYGSDPVASEVATYCMLDTLDLELAVKDYAKFTASFMGKKLVSASAQTPAYTSDNPFLAKHAEVKFAATESALNAASASNVQRFKLTVSKNLVDVQAFGDTDISSIHNKQFGIAGDMEAVYEAVTYRDYVANSTKKACRFSFINDEVTPLYNAIADDIFPSIYIDLARISFKEWTRSSDNNALVSQTAGFSGEFSVNDAMTLEILLLNAHAAVY